LITLKKEYYSSRKKVLLFDKVEPCFSDEISLKLYGDVSHLKPWDETEAENDLINKLLEKSQEKVRNGAIISAKHQRLKVDKVMNKKDFLTSCDYIKCCLIKFTPQNSRFFPFGLESSDCDRLPYSYSESRETTNEFVLSGKVHLRFICKIILQKNVDFYY
jgi:hypothetical protein